MAPDPLPPTHRALLERTRAHYEAAPTTSRGAGRSYRRRLAHFYNRMIPDDASVLEIGCGGGELLALLRAKAVTGVDLAGRQLEAARRRVPHGTFVQQAGEALALPGTFDYIILSDTLNYAADVQQLLERARTVAAPHTRLLINVASALWQPVFAIANATGLRVRPPQSSWLGRHDVANLLGLAGWEVVRSDTRILVPVPLAGLDVLMNRWVAPLVPVLGLSDFFVARLREGLAESAGSGPAEPSVSVIVPARNEAGNIAAIVARTPQLGSGTELIFVEGHSRDDTWAKIQDAQRENPGRAIRILQQPGDGKGDAVRAGFAHARGDMLMILDADLTVPPEDLPKFYAALASGHAEFANGVRLVYPVEKEAMRFLNMCANKFFVAAFSWLLGQPVKDTLCGTKVLWRRDYERIAAGRAYFGDFDPFGDFDLLFGADRLNLRIVDVPIRYQERSFGTTNIRRWKHGWLLLRMVAFAARKLKFV